MKKIICTDNIRKYQFENVNLSNVAKDGKIYRLFDDGFIMADIEISNNLEIKFITGHALAFQVFGKLPEDYDYVYRIIAIYQE